MTQTPTKPELDKPDELVELFEDYHIIKYENAGTSETDWYELYESVRALLEKEALKARLDERKEAALDNYQGQTFSEATNWHAKFDKFVRINERRIATLEKQLGSK